MKAADGRLPVILICAGTRITHESIMGLQLSFYRGIHRLKGTKTPHFFSPQTGEKRTAVFYNMLVAGGIGFGNGLVGQRSSDWVEQYYSLWFYPRWAGVLAALTTPVPFSLAEWIVILAAVGALAFLIRSIWIIAHKKGEEKLLLLLMLFFGQEERQPWSCFSLLCPVGSIITDTHFLSIVVLRSKNLPVSQLTALCQELADTANQLRSGHAGSRGEFPYAPQAIGRCLNRRWKAIRH